MEGQKNFPYFLFAKTIFNTSFALAKRKKGCLSFTISLSSEGIGVEFREAKANLKERKKALSNQ
jgi:hypothetical protein